MRAGIPLRGQATEIAANTTNTPPARACQIEDDEQKPNIERKGHALGEGGHDGGMKLNLAFYMSPRRA